MTNESYPIDQLKDTLIQYSLRPVLDDEIWECFGYNGRAREGILSKIFDKSHKLKDVLTYELTLMGLSDVIYSISVSEKSENDRIMLVVSAIDEIINKLCSSYNADNIIDDLYETYNYLLNDNGESYTKYYNLMNKYKKYLNDENHKSHIKGFICFFDTYNLNNGYFYDLAVVTKFINRTKIYGDMQINWSDSFWNNHENKIDMMCMLDVDSYESEHVSNKQNDMINEIYAKVRKEKESPDLLQLIKNEFGKKAEINVKETNDIIVKSNKGYTFMFQLNNLSEENDDETKCAIIEGPNALRERTNKNISRASVISFSKYAKINDKTMNQIVQLSTFIIDKNAKKKDGPKNPKRFTILNGENERNVITDY